jgi:hypothetical protein
MATAKAASERISEGVTSWTGVEAGPGSRGEIEVVWSSAPNRRRRRATVAVDLGITRSSSG